MEMFAGAWAGSYIKKLAVYVFFGGVCNYFCNYVHIDHSNVGCMSPQDVLKNVQCFLD